MLSPVFGKFPFARMGRKKLVGAKGKTCKNGKFCYGRMILSGSQSEKIAEESARPTFDDKIVAKKVRSSATMLCTKIVHYQRLKARILQNGSVQASYQQYNVEKEKVQVKMDEKRRIWVGLDVSKASFFASVDNLERYSQIGKLPARNFPRTAVGAGSCLKWIRSCIANDETPCLVMETTGCYSKELAQWFQNYDSTLHIAIQNGRMISDFIKSLNLNKTDISDAQAIARFGSDRNPAPTRTESKKWLELREFERERTALIESRGELENRKDSLFSAIGKKINGRAVAALTLQIKAIDKEIAKLIHEDDEMRKEVQIMSTMPGVSFVSAANLLAEFGSLKQYTSRELSQLSGLAPRLFQSGSSLNKSFLGRRGSKRGRQILYLDSISAIPHIPFLKALYDRIVARGKTKMCARCACMRKMLLILRAMVVHDTFFDNEILEKFQIGA